MTRPEQIVPSVILEILLMKNNFGFSKTTKKNVRPKRNLPLFPLTAR